MMSLSCCGLRLAMMAVQAPKNFAAVDAEQHSKEKLN